MKVFNNNTLFEEDIPEDLVKSGVEIAVDTESMGLLPQRDRLCVVQFSFGDGKCYLVHFSKSSHYDAPNLKALLGDPNNLKIFHFARADITNIYYYLGVLTQTCYCTKVASRLARTYTDHHGLKELCYELLGVKLNKYHQCSDWGADNLSAEQVEYAASDVLHLHKLRDKLNKMLQREDRLELALGCINFIPCRVNLDMLGWGDDIFKHDCSYNNKRY